TEACGVDVEWLADVGVEVEGFFHWQIGEDFSRFFPVDVWESEHSFAAFRYYVNSFFGHFNVSHLRESENVHHYRRKTKSSLFCYLSSSCRSVHQPQSF